METPPETIGETPKSVFQPQAWSSNRQDPNQRGDNTTKPNNAWVGLVDSQPIQWAWEITKVFQCVKQERRMTPQGETKEEKKRLHSPRAMGSKSLYLLATRRQVLPGLLLLYCLLHTVPELIQILSQVHHQGVVVASGGPLAPFLLVNVGV